MGCDQSSPGGTSSQEPSAPKSRIGVKLLVLPDKESESKEIKFYNMTKCRMEGSVEVPLQQGISSPGYTVAAHPNRPTLYITGPDSENVQHIYQLSLQGFNQELTESRATLPESFLPYKSVVACIGEDEYLYVFNVKGECHRLDLTLNVLEHIDKPKGPITTVGAILVVKSCLFMVVDEALWILDQSDLDCMWVQAVESGFPKGQYTVVGDYLYILDLEGQNVKRYAVMTSQFEDVKDFVCDELQPSISLVGFGEDTICFTQLEPSENDENTKQVILYQYDLKKHKAKKAGLLKKCPTTHKLELCWA